MNTDDFQALFAATACRCGTPASRHTLGDHAHLAPLFGRLTDPDDEDFLADLAAIARSPDRRP